ncbi:MAG: hypothetical protein ABJB61_01240 [bacterium]
MFRRPTSTRIIFSLRLLLMLSTVALALTAVAYDRYGVTAQNRNPRATPDGPDTIPLVGRLFRCDCRDLLVDGKGVMLPARVLNRLIL